MGKHGPLDILYFSSEEKLHNSHKDQSTVTKLEFDLANYINVPKPSFSMHGEKRLESWAETDEQNGQLIPLALIVGDLHVAKI